MIWNIHTAGSRIVRSYAGSGTAETIYETEDGRRWRYNAAIPNPPRRDGTAVGSGLGEIVNGRIIDVP
jgi:hypothetical protein